MEFRAEVALAPYTTFQIGGPAQWFAEAANEGEVLEALSFSAERGLPLFILGGGSNLLVSDGGYRGLVLRIALLGVEEHEDAVGRKFAVGAGEDWDRFVALTVARGCAGMECLSGIPGTVGGTPVQNVGAYGQEVSQSITCVRAYDRAGGGWVELPASACGFGYRRSIFNTLARDRYIVTRVDFRLRYSQSATITYPDLRAYFKDSPAAPTPAAVREAVRTIRHGKGMLLVEGEDDCRSAGSFFKNPVVDGRALPGLAATLGIEEDRIPRFAADDGRVKLPAAWLLDKAGFSKGYRLGRAGISTRHTLALTNRGGASAAEIAALRDQIEDAVQQKFGIALEPEPVWLG